MAGPRLILASANVATRLFQARSRPRLRLVDWTLRIVEVFFVVVVRVSRFRPLSWRLGNQTWPLLRVGRVLSRGNDDDRQNQR